MRNLVIVIDRICLFYLVYFILKVEIIEGWGDV